jgi:hypothetical protein
MLTKEGDDNLNTEGDKSCLMTVDTGTSVTVRPDIPAGLPEKELTWPHVLQMASGKTSILKESLIEFTLG